MFDVHLENGIIGTCNVWLQNIFHHLQFVDEGGNSHFGNLTDNASPEYMNIILDHLKIFQKKS